MIAFFRLLTELSSRKQLSRLTGWFAKSRLSKLFIRKFAKTYQIDVHEAEHDLTQYQSLNQFFTRRLRAGARPIDSGEHVVVSPVDAIITGMGKIERGLLLNVKGQDYTLSELLQDEQKTKQFTSGFYFVLYLSPRDYHRIHTPVRGTILEKRHLPGKVYPVNEFGLRHMKRVLSRNERLITYIRAITHQEFAVVKVGALNVSSIQYVNPLPQELEKGDELAYFEFGSTIVLLIDQDFIPDQAVSLGERVKMGTSLGTIQRS
jgi:phosphatidylserine decarboxylase